MKVLCLIPTRSCTKNHEGQSTERLNGISLLEYTFQTALRAGDVDKIIISTDDPLAAQTAYTYNIDVPFLRPKHLAKDDTPIYDVVLHAIKFLEQAGEHYDIICLLQPTVPFRNEGFIDKCIKHFISSEADSFCSVTKVPHQFNPHWLFEEDEDGFLKIATGDEKLIPSRRLLPKVFAKDGSVYLFKTEVIKRTQDLHGEKISYLESDNKWHIQIDTKDDWYKAEMIAHVLASVN